MSSPWLDPEILADALQDRLRTPPKRLDKQFRFVPQLSYGRHRGPAPPDARPAAVTLLLYPRGDGWFLPLTLRPETLSAHAGQISLPGGSIDAGEAAEGCALRELQEEIGVAAEHVRILGRLSPVYVYRSGFLVQPFVALAAKTPAFQTNPAEVEQLIEIPVEQLFDVSRYSKLWIVQSSLRYQSPCICYARHRIWGATLKVLGEFLDLSRDLFAGC